jgi:hypothetical protein
LRSDQTGAEAKRQILAEEIPQYTIKTAAISDKYSKAQLRKSMAPMSAAAAAYDSPCAAPSSYDSLMMVDDDKNDGTTNTTKMRVLLTIHVPWR